MNFFAFDLSFEDSQFYKLLIPFPVGDENCSFKS